MEVVDSTTTDKDPTDLTEILLRHKKFYEILDDANSEKEYRYFFLQGNNFKLHPAAGSSNEFIRIFYVKRLPVLVADSDVSEIPAQHHELLAVKAARRGLIKTRIPNPVLEQQHLELLATFMTAIQRFSRLREERREPWRGSYGPDRDIRGGQTVI